MPEMSLAVKAVMVGFMVLMVVVVVAYHIILDPRRPEGGDETAAPAKEAKARSGRAA